MDCRRSAALLFAVAALAGCSSGAGEATWLHGRWTYFQGEERRPGQAQEIMEFRADGSVDYIYAANGNVMAECNWRPDGETVAVVRCPVQGVAERFRREGDDRLVLEQVGSVWYRE